MGKTYSRVRSIDTLAAITGCTEYIKLTVIQIQMEICLLYTSIPNSLDRPLYKDAVYGIRKINTMAEAAILSA